MRQGFSKQWTSSVRPRNQRKARRNAPLHIRENLIRANLSKELREKYDRRNMPVRVGDKVKIMKGSYKGKISKVMFVNHTTLKVNLEDIKRKKSDGREVHVPFQSSNLQIVSLFTEDKKRLKALERKKKAVGGAAKPAPKAETKVAAKETKTSEKKVEKSKKAPEKKVVAKKKE